MNNLPQPLKEAIENLIADKSLSQLLEARQQLSKRYQERGHQKFINHEAQRYAYLLSRMPATFAVIDKVFQIFVQANPEKMESLLDLGTGPGTLAWSANGHFPDLRELSLVEKDAEMSKLGKVLFSQEPALESKVVWKMQNFALAESLPESDLVTASYALSELSSAELTTLFPKLWQCVIKYCLIIEPGTPYGFKVIEQLRQFWLERGGAVIAPCTHFQKCPLAGQGWCHFSERINRSKEERFLKQGQLSYEDEKFSYLILSKLPLPPKKGGRILHSPRKASGHIHFNLCTEEGIQDVIISKKQGERYRQAKKLEWGDWIGLAEEN